MNKKLTTKDLAYIALCAVLLAVCSWISVPFAVPFTLQTFGVFCTLLILGGKRGTVAIVVFILMAAVGLPVLSGFRGGVGALLGTTGGYILGFVLTGLIYWAGTSLASKGPGHSRTVPVVQKCTRRTVPKVLCLIVGLIVCYAFGTAWFMSVYAKGSGPIGLGTALSWCVLPFIIPDIIKLALAVFVSSRMIKRVSI